MLENTEIHTTPLSPPLSPMASLKEGSPEVSVQTFMDAGVHFGHQSRRWNPKMAPYIYGTRRGVHILDLDQTVKCFAQARAFLWDVAARGGNVLMVGTKRQAQEIVKEEAVRSDSFFVINRWLGGTLTNFRTIRQGLERLKHLERMKEDGTYEQLAKKELARLEKERERFEKYIGGLKKMGSLPNALFVIDPSKEEIAVREANTLGIPIVAITDTNCNPDRIDYIIPGNDDAVRSISLITRLLADAIVDGKAHRQARNPQDKDESEEKSMEGAHGHRPQPKENAPLQELPA